MVEFYKKIILMHVLFSLYSTIFNLMKTNFVIQRPIFYLIFEGFQNGLLKIKHEVYICFLSLFMSVFSVCSTQITAAC